MSLPNAHLFVFFTVLCLASASDVVVVFGATDRTGLMFYKFSKELNVNVRGFIWNVTKTRERLGSIACDTSEGTFVGDVTDPSTFLAPMDGAHSLFHATKVPLVYSHVTDLRRPSIPVIIFPSMWISTGVRTS